MGLKARTWWLCFREAWTNLGRNGLMTLASIGTVVVSLLVLGSFFLLVMNFNHMAKLALHNAKVRVVLADSVEFDATEQVRTWLRNRNDVASFSFVSREEALVRLEDMLGRPENLFVEGDEEIMPESFDVVLKPGSNPDLLSRQIKNLSGVSKVLYGRDFFRRMMTLIRLTWIGGLVIFGLVAFAMLLIITNTIRLTVFARRREIEIMGLVGATEGYIRLPFLFEGLLIGSFGALISGLVLSRGYYFLAKKLADAAPFLDLLTHNAVQRELTWALLGMGAVFGLIGSVISIKRFLRAS